MSEVNWDEKAEDYARETSLSRESILVAARWQRDQLRTDEAVERVAESIWSTDPAPETENETWADQEDEMKADYRKAARAAITALIEEEP